MTYREAARQAGRELGMSEDQLNAADAHADRMAPHEQANSRQEIEPGREREVIDGMKERVKATWDERNKSN